MKTMISRRDALKLLSLIPVAITAGPLLSMFPASGENAPHVLVFVFDAWSARHLSMHGYPRQTMPNLERFAKKSFVYHNHFSAGSFTVPGAASLLTGLYPWNHGALHLGGGGVHREHITHNLFTIAQETHSSVAYAQNPYADLFLQQFDPFLDLHLASNALNLASNNVYSLPIFKKDGRIAFGSFEENIIQTSKGYSASLFASLGLRFKALATHKRLWSQYRTRYPKGLPSASGFFLLDDVVDQTVDYLRKLTVPSMVYFHFFPPHEPYTPSKQFNAYFSKNIHIPEKQVHPLSLTRYPEETLRQSRTNYDRYLSSWDAAIQRLFDFLTTSGLVDKSVIIFTSDHGELFEQGELGHLTPLMTAPVVHVPLVVSLPGQRKQKNIHTPTSSVDLLPTIASLLDAPSPVWTDGQMLPGLGGREDANRSIYSFDAKLSSSFQKPQQLSIALVKDGHRLLYYQYPGFTRYELYNLSEDPYELNDLYSSMPSLAKKLKAELEKKLQEINGKFHP